MSRAPTVLAFTLALGGVVLIEGAGAAPRQGDDRQITAATGALVPPRIAVALPARRAAIPDPDLDGIVTRAEAARYYEARFALIDRDRDGRLSGREFLRPAAVRSRQARGSSRVAPLDYDAAGTDSAGALTAKELLGSNNWRGASPIAAGADGQRQAIFDALDADRDGALSRQEFTAAGAEDFAASDADGNRRVTTREFYAGKRL